MVDGTQSEYFISRTEVPDGKILSVFYSPVNNGLSIPREVVRAKSMSGAANEATWKGVTGKLLVSETPVQAIEPSSVEQIGLAVQDFMRATVRGGIFVDDDTPKEVIEVLSAAEVSLKTESRTRLLNFLGVDLKTPTAKAADDKHSTGFYL